MNTLGLILAGGWARRMGGGDKGARVVGGRSVFDRVIARLQPQVERIVINANGDPARFAEFGLPVVADNLPDRPGPLAGVLAGLDWIATHAPAVEWMVSAPADAPFVPTDLVARLHAAREESGFSMACATSAGRAHPVIALWPVAGRERLRAALASGMRKVGAFTDGAGIAEWPAEPIDPFFNVNTPEDLAEADRLAKLLSL